MDEKPKCSHDEPITQLSTQKDRSADKDDQTAVKEGTPATKIQTVLTIDQTIYSIDQPALLKDQSAYSKEELAHPKDQPAAYSRHQLAYSKTQNALTEDQPATYSKDQLAYSKSQIDLTKDQPVVSTKDEAAMTVIPKNLVDALIEKYSKKFEPGISVCVARVASATPSYNMNNGYLSSNAPLKISSSTQNPIATQPVSQLPVAASVAVASQPPSLFLQALSKLNDSSLTLAVISHFRLQSSSNLSKVYKIESGEITPPDSLSSAPPTYSFVLRQLAVRRRPRFLGTFLPSPSFVQHAPPPTYAGAFDVYIEPALPPPPARVYTFGFASMPIVCPECGYTGMTVVTSHVTICTHLCAFILCLLCCWICAPLPYLLRSCKDVYHYCRNCRCFLGMYCPTNPESVAYQNVT